MVHAQGGRPTERAATLKRTLELSHKHTQDLQSVISNVFQAVFAHRFRDVAPAVRSCVIGGIGCWVCSLPTIYLKDQFLKYLAWALSDKVGVEPCPAQPTYTHMRVLIDIYIYIWIYTYKNG